MQHRHSGNRLVCSNFQMSAILPKPSEGITRFKEVAVAYDPKIAEVLGTLSPAELEFVYYFRRACLPGNRIAADQFHRFSLPLIEALRWIAYAEPNSFSINGPHGVDSAKLIEQCRTYLVYFFSNHGPYFVREHRHNKRTPSSLGLDVLTQSNMVNALQQLGHGALASRIDNECGVLFDIEREHTATVNNEIRSSGSNFYAVDFTDDDYSRLTTSEQNATSGYFEVKVENGVRKPYHIPACVTGKHSHELVEIVKWLTEARNVARANPQHFDDHFVSSLDHVIKYFETGDESEFNKHSIEWLQSKSRIDYNIGYIESYDDPMGKRGTFQAEVTVKCIDINTLNAMLPKFESCLPYDIQYQRDSLGVVPNASINCKIFGSGALGPANITAAYCLPNDETIRSTYGSKQIIYPSAVSIAFRQNPDRARLLMFSRQDREFMESHDPLNMLGNMIWDVQCILHETVGHGSGRLTTHVFVDGDALEIAGTLHHVGDEIPVTPQNIGPLLQGYEHTIEELRAEIISLYISVENVVDLAQSGILGKWLMMTDSNNQSPDSVLTIKQMQEKFVFGMTASFLRRMIQQNDEALKTGSIHGDHARANTIITHKLADDGGIEFVREHVVVDGEDYTVVSVNVCDLDKARRSISDLVKLVQHIKSTGNGVEAKRLVDTYGSRVRLLDDMVNVKRCYRATVGDIAMTCAIYPHLYKDEQGAVRAVWPTDIFDMYKQYGDEWAY